MKRANSVNRYLGKLTPVLVVTALLVAPTALATDSFRCGTHVISQGLEQSKLLQYCGEPSERRDGDTWVYDWGAERQVMVVTFDSERRILRIATE